MLPHTCNPRNFLGDILGRKHKINASAGDRALRHIRLPGGIQFLRDGNATGLFDAAQRGSPIPIIARDNDRNQFAVPVVGEGSQKNRDDIGPPTRLGDRLQSEFAVEYVQISLRWDNENMVGLDDQFFRDQLDRHRGAAWENFVKSGGDGSLVIDNDDGHALVIRQVL